jgi:predicted HAD superfamily phosphohydrolase
MLKEVAREGGMSIAFNANEYALRESTVGLASTHISDLDPLIIAWEEGGREGVKRMVRGREGGEGDRSIFHWLPGREDLSLVKEVHLRLRRLMRREAALLG